MFRFLTRERPPRKTKVMQGLFIKKSKQAKTTYVGEFLEVIGKMANRKNLPDTILRPEGIFQWYSGMVQNIADLNLHEKW